MNSLPDDNRISGVLKIAKQTIFNEIKCLEAVKERLGDEFLRAVARILDASGKIVVFGVGKSGIVAKKIAATLCATGTPSLDVHPVDALHGDSGVLMDGDVLIIVSNSGSTPELLSFIDVIDISRFPIIGILGNTESPLSEKCEVVLDASIEREACPLNLTPTSSVVTAIAIGDALSSSLITIRGFSSDDFGRRHPAGSLGRRLLLRVSDVMHAGKSIPLAGQDDILADVLVELSSKAMGAVLVVNETGKLEGIFTDGDLRRCLQKYENILQMRVGDLMTRRPTFTHSQCMAIDALQLMQNRSSEIAVLPVINEHGSIEGIIRIHDLVKLGLK